MREGACALLDATAQSLPACMFMHAWRHELISSQHPSGGQKARFAGASKCQQSPAIPALPIARCSVRQLPALHGTRRGQPAASASSPLRPCGTMCVLWAGCGRASSLTAPCDSKTSKTEIARLRRLRTIRSKNIVTFTTFFRVISVSCRLWPPLRDVLMRTSFVSYSTSP